MIRRWKSCVGIGADLVSVSDAQGHIILSTDLSSAGTTIAEPFLNHIHEIVYTDVEFRLEDAKPVIQAASTLGNGHGMVQVSYSASTVQALLQKSRILQQTCRFMDRALLQL